MTEFEKDRASRSAQRTLAYEVTQLVHGKNRADSVKKATGVLFGEGDFTDLKDDEISMLKGELPVVKAKADLAENLVEAGLAGSKTEARNFQVAGAIYVNGQKVGLNQQPSFQKGDNLLKRGKNRFAIIQF